MGWTGSRHELHYVLQYFGCDRDDHGAFMVDGAITSFMGAGEDFVVGDDAVFYVKGKPQNLAHVLATSGYGLQVKVI